MEWGKRSARSTQKGQKIHDKLSIIFLYGLNSNIHKEAIELGHMPWTGVSKPLVMKKTLKFEFRFKFHDFWSYRTFSMYSQRFYQVMNEILIEWHKFSQTYNLESNFELGFHKQR
jgi:hypothetical protein